MALWGGTPRILTQKGVFEQVLRPERTALRPLFFLVAVAAASENSLVVDANTVPSPVHGVQVVEASALLESVHGLLASTWHRFTLSWCLGASAAQTCSRIFFPVMAPEGGRLNAAEHLCSGSTAGGVTLAPMLFLVMPPVVRFHLLQLGFTCALVRSNAERL